MFKLQNQFKIFYFCLLIFLGLFLMNNHPVIAMNNNYSNGNATPNNGHRNIGFEAQARILLEMNLEQANLTQQIFNARNNNASEEIINNLVRQNIELSQRISAQQIILHDAMPRQNNRNQTNNQNNQRH